MGVIQIMVPQITIEDTPNIDKLYVHNQGFTQ